MKFRYLIGAACFFVAASTWATEHVVGQRDKAFTVERLRVRVGDAVKFTNEDPFFHNVFSLSDTKTFDLGSYPQGQARKVTFDEPGKVEVECALHPTMKMIIEVTK